MSKSKQASKRKRSAFEWSILIVSAGAIATILVGLVLYSIQFESSKAVLSVSIEPEAGKDNTYLVTVENRGGTTAEDVVVDVRRGEESQLVEFRAVPKDHSEEAVVSIEGSGEPTASIKTFKEP